MVDEREELANYLEGVVREVERRLAVVRQLQSDIREIEGELVSMRSSRVSDVRILQSQSGFQGSLNRKIESKKQELKVAQEDLERAQEREVSIREELKELEE